MRARSAGRHYLWPNIVCARVVSGLVCFAGRCMDLIPRAEHEVGRMLSIKLAHLVWGGQLFHRGHTGRAACKPERAAARHTVRLPGGSLLPRSRVARRASVAHLRGGARRHLLCHLRTHRHIPPPEPPHCRHFPRGARLLYSARQGVRASKTSVTSPDHRLSAPDTLSCTKAGALRHRYTPHHTGGLTFASALLLV